MKNVRLLKSLLLGATTLSIAAPLMLSAAYAQSTGTQEVETVVVTGARTTTNGLMNAQPISKEQSTITSDFLKTQPAGQTVFQSLNFMPGVNFTNNDPYGSS